MKRTWILIGILALASPIACDRQDGGGEADDAEAEVRIDPGLGTLRVANQTTEPVAIHMDGEELYTVPSGRAYTFRNLPTREVDVYGVGRISRKHYDLPRLTIEEGGEYEWTIRP
ncbi:MAG: hypothetical protein R3199_07665 [Gemmatimonadota bacterium]|nr:hypothetical protein [Gemmatimonadota bacterium]